MRLGIDIDGTIKDTHRAAIQVYNRKLNRSVRLEDITDFYLDRAYGLTRSEGERLWRQSEEEIYTIGVPLPHAVDVLNDLARTGFEIYYITARPKIEKLEMITKRWLEKMGFPFAEEKLWMGSENKALIAKQLGIDLFFEDAPVHLDRLVAHRIPTVIMDAVYNRHYPHPLQRMRDWREIYQIIDR